MISWSSLEFYYEPYPIGLATRVLPENTYAELVDSFPPRDLFKFKKSLGNKYSLSEINHADRYRDFIEKSKIWGEFHGWIKSKEFIYEVLRTLQAKHIDLGWPTSDLTGRQRLSTFVSNLRRHKFSSLPVNLNARFEFSMLPANGGHIKPHTDAPQKLITLIISMIKPGEWNPGYGGGTEVLTPKDINFNYNHMNKEFEFDDVRTIRTFPFNPNQCLVFIKTFNSFHAVRPMTGTDERLMRKTLTINIERLD